MFERHSNLLALAAENVARKPRGYAVAASALLLALVPLLAGVAVSEGLKAQALASLDVGADLYCSWDTFGRGSPLPNGELDALRDVGGVTRVVPRIVGRVPIAGEIAILIGVPLAELQGEALAKDRSLSGSLPGDASEVLVGCELARSLGLRPGMQIALEGEILRLFRIAGVTSSTSALWSAKAIVCERGEAAEVFGEREHVSDACVWVRPGYVERAALAIGQLDPRYHVQTRALAQAAVLRGMTQREGLFTILFTLALALGTVVFAVMAWLAATPRSREIGLLKAEGWSAGDVLELAALENFLVSLVAAAGALALSALWVRVLHGWLLAPFFVPDLPWFPRIELPARFLPLPALLAFAFSLVVTMTGSLCATWRTASVRPAAVLR
jgi:ABC-type lipoprotein release transport system permease subunit